MNAISVQDTLIFVMVSISAVDRNMNETEMLRIGNVVKTLPVFDGYNSDQLVNAAKTCRDILQEEEGLETVLGFAAALPENLQRTAYVLAAEIAAADLSVSAEEVRLLQLLRNHLDIDKLTCAALELAAPGKTSDRLTAMETIIADHESAIRLTASAALFALFALSEWVKPRRKLTASKSQRWITNLSIVVLDSLLVRLLFPAAAVGVALWASSAGYGVFNLIAMPFWLSLIISIIVLDFAVWLSHLLSHKVPVFWRIHRMHHADPDIDVSTAIRFHPIEIILSMIYKAAWVVLLGAPAAAVILFETLLNGTAIFNHSNTKLPSAVDRIVRLFLVTPDMHRVHHSTLRDETDSNYGFNLPWWDRLFGTYVDQPSKGHSAMDIGLPQWQDERPTRLGWSLSVPFLKKS